MNKLKLMTVLLLLVLTLSSALATFEAGDVKLGDASQERSEEDKVVQTFTVQNTGSLDIKDAAVDFSGVLGKYDAVASLSDTDIAAGGEVTLTVEAYITYDLDAVDSKGRKISVDVGDVVLTGLYSDDSDVPEKRLTFLMEAENQLEFKTGSDGTLITIDGDEDRLRDGDEFDGDNGVRRDADVELKLVVENNFNDNDECDDDDCVMDNVEVTIDSDDKDVDLDSEDVDIDDIDPEEDEFETFSFDIPDDADDNDRYDVEMWVTGEDPNGALHGEYWQFELKVEVEDDEVTIEDFELSPSRLSCGDTSSTLRVTVENTGDKDQDEISIWIESNRLDIKESIYHISLDDGDSTTRTFSINVEDDLPVGQYFIQIIANVDHSEETDRQTATLYVDECNPDDDDTPIEDDDDVITVIEVPPTTGGVIYGESKGFFDSTEYVIMLGGFFVIALLMFFILLAVLLKK